MRVSYIESVEDNMTGPVLHCLDQTMRGKDELSNTDIANAHVHSATNTILICFHGCTGFRDEG